jgi:hypothetical protein
MEVTMPDVNLRQDLDGALAEIKALQNRIAALESQSTAVGHIPRTALLSDSFLKRSFTIWGHNFVAGIIIALPIWLVVMAVLLMLGVMAR